MSSIPTAPPPWNEPVRMYAPGTPEREELKSTLEALADVAADALVRRFGEDLDEARERR